MLRASAESRCPARSHQRSTRADIGRCTVARSSSAGAPRRTPRRANPCGSRSNGSAHARSTGCFGAAYSFGMRSVLLIIMLPEPMNAATVGGIPRGQAPRRRRRTFSRWIEHPDVRSPIVILFRMAGLERTASPRASRRYNMTRSSRSASANRCAASRRSLECLRADR
jgi:hypothetical protein